MKQPKEHCPWCNKQVALTKHAAFRYHGETKGRKTPCRGSGRDPEYARLAFAAYMNECKAIDEKGTAMTGKTIRQIKAVYTDGPDFCVAEERERFSTSADCFNWFKGLKDETKESMVALHLDNKNRLICADVISVGSLTASIVHPREVFKTALLSSAAAIVLVHNHPSGDPEPSREDLDITSRLRQCAELFGIRLLDHIIIGDNRYVSLADRGLLG